MSTPAILAVDQGTTNTKAMLVTRDGEILASAARQVPVEHPQAGWAEQSAAAIRDSVAEAIAEVMAGFPAANVQAVALSNQRESVLVWDAATGEPLGPCIIWQCRRSAPLCARLRSEGHEALVRERTGLGLDPLFSAGKLAWLLKRVPPGRQIRAGTVDSWLLWNLTGGAVHATDASNASRTQLLNLETISWDAEMLGLFGIPPGILPEVRASDANFGATSGGFGGLPDGIPIRAAMGDSHAALYGHGITGPGRIKVTIGTGSSLMCPTGGRQRSTHGLSETVAWSARGEVVRALEGNITVSGQTAAFACDLLGLADPEVLTDLALTVPDSDGVCFVPALAGLGAPHWREDARGLISGMTLRTRPAHVARAALEAIAHQICDVVEAMEADLGQPVEAICADGSAARNDLLLQLIADFTGRTVLRASSPELSAIGAALMAWDVLDAAGSQPRRSAAREFDRSADAERLRQIRAHWSSNVAKA